MGNEAISVLHVDTGREWRGGQQQAAYLCQALHERGYQTAIVCQPKSSFEQFCRENDLPYYPILMRGELDFRAGFRIAQICRKRNFKILHVHDAHALAIGLWAKYFFSRLKLIAVRRVDFHIKKNLFSQFKYNNRRLDKIVCISNAIKNVLVSDGIDATKLITIHSGINIEKFNLMVPPPDFKETLGIPKDHVLIGTIASLAGHKDYPNLLKAAKMVIDQTDQVTFCTVGDGPDRDSILKMANELKLGARFVFTGFRADVGNFLKSFDIFVLASKKEGLGTSLLDAQAVGLPVVACATGGIPEAIFHNHNGLLVPPQNPEALAKAILLLIQDGNLRKKFGENSRASVKRFDISLTINRNIQLYTELTKKTIDLSIGKK